MSLGVEVGGWIASAVISKLVDKVQSYISDQYGYEAEVKCKLKCLAEDITKIQCVLDDADKRRIESPSMQQWLRNLKDASYEAEDILDVFEYKILEDKVEKTVNQVSSTSCRLIKRARTIAKRFSFSDDDVKQLNDVVDKFRSIVTDMGHLIELIKIAPTIKENVHEIMQSRESTSMCTEPQLFGRDRERNDLIEKLLEINNSNDGASSSENVHVLPLVGMGGVGKTSLIQDVSRNQNVEGHFDLKAWVCVSDDFDVKRLATEIIESAGIPTPENFHILQNLDSVLKILKKGLMGRKFLIVLDDVWNKVAIKWEMLQRALNFGEKGSRVVVTTRDQKIADMMGTGRSITLGGLLEDEYWRFFVRCAFGDKDPKCYPILEFIGREIAKNLGGNPLAAKTVGSMLKYDLNVARWREVLESKWWKVNHQEGGIMSVLRLSYDYLPKHLKQCFIYCSLFPQDYPFEVSELVRLWIAHGFVQSDVEEVGVGYFDELFSRSFFQKAKYPADRYVIHDLLHDLARELSGGEICDCSENKSIEDPKRVRHVYVGANNLSPVCNNEYVKKNLRSLVVKGCYKNPLKMLEELRGLRVLIVDDFEGELLSESIFNKMVHLRYLRLRDPTATFKLPKSIGVLYHIQVIRLHRVWNYGRDIVLPEEINRLVNLRHLDADTGGVAGIGTLTLLEELNIHVKQREDGFEMRQLGGMSELRQLKIAGLESVGSKQEACGAMLEKKQRLKELSLFWTARDDVDGQSLDLVVNNEEVLGGLRPHHNLEELTIRYYLGRRSPSWWDGSWAASCSYLQKIELEFCQNWEVLPPFGQLPHLKYLSLMGMKGVKRMGTEVCVSGSSNSSSSMIVFPALETLHLRSMPVLMEWWKTEENGGHGNTKIEWYPRLSYLSINDCPKLRGPLSLPSHLKVLSVKIRVPRYLLKLKGGRACSAASTTEGLFVSFPDVSSLIGWVPLQNLSAIEELTFHNLAFRRFPPELGEWFQHLTSLRALRFEYCDVLESLPEEGLPASLRELNIFLCSNELAKGCSKEENGREWHKISHIPTIRIDRSSSSKEFSRQQYFFHLKEKLRVAKNSCVF